MPKAKIKTSQEYEKEFLEAFTRKLVFIKEKAKKEQEKERAEEEREALTKAIGQEREKRRVTKIAEIERKLRPSIMKTAEREEMRERLKKISIEREERAGEKAEIKPPTERAPAPKPTPSAMIAPPTAAEAAPLVVAPTIPEIPPPPVYRRGLPPLPKPPKITATWPIPPPPPKAPVTISLATVIDLGKLNTFVQDNLITVIQCDGANVPVKTVKEGRVSETIITLSENEIRDIIKRFADRTNQVITEPVFKTQIGNLAFTAILSSFTGSRFVISKI